MIGILLYAALLTVISPCGLSAAEVTVRHGAELQLLFAQRVDSLVVRLEPGIYDLTPQTFIDSTCGNCEDPSTIVMCSVGLHVRGNFVHLKGPADRSAIVRTKSGYGLFVDRCDSVIIENLQITAGERDTSGLATDAGIVVKHSHATIRNNRIADNIGDSSIVASRVVGIMGIAGREGSRLVITGNEIIRNSWDGIALYRGAEAEIGGNIIDGVDKARGSVIGGGRGVAIGVTWDAKATIRGNLVKRYWKGIGLFVDAQGIVENNIVEDIITWGISLWDAGKGAPVGFISRNVIYKTGACGASIALSEEGVRPGVFAENVIAVAGQNPKYDSPDYYCYQCALALHSLPSHFTVEGNVYFNNRRASENLPDEDMTKPEFLRAVAPLCHSFSEHPVLQRADFVADFCGGP